jgi:hypothetical protein
MRISKSQTNKIPGLKNGKPSKSMLKKDALALAEIIYDVYKAEERDKVGSGLNDTQTNAQGKLKNA